MVIQQLEPSDLILFTSLRMEMISLFGNTLTEAELHLFQQLLERQSTHHNHPSWGLRGRNQPHL